MIRARRALVALAVLAACQPRAWPIDEACPAGLPGPGEVVVAEVSCGDMEIAGGEGRPADLYVANSRLRAVLRHPQDAQTLVGVGGGTVIDAAPWGGRDRLHEIAPLVGGGWIAVEEWALEPDGVRLAGPVVALPDRPASTPGAWREVTWRVVPDVPWLELEGADGLWLHAAGSAEVLDGQVLAGDVVYGHDGVVDVDLGGALRIAFDPADGPARLVIASPADAWAALADDPVPVSGVAEGATSVAAYRDDVVVARLPVVDGRFVGALDRSVTHLEARASGHAPSARVAPGEDVVPTLGGAGSVVLRPAWTCQPRPFRVTWTSADGRGGRAVFDADGGTLPLGAGAFDLVVSAGPAWQPRALRVELGPDDVATVPFALDPAFDPEGRALVAIGWPGDRARTWRGSDLSAGLLASGAGYDYAVFTPEDEVSSVDSDQVGFPPLLARRGSLLADRADRWRIWSWSWSANDKNNAHGVPDLAGRSAEDALALAWGGPSRDRHTVVDLPWFAEVGAPFAVSPTPGMVHLAHPGPDLTSWQPWFDWLDAGQLLTPVGPYTWVEVADADAIGAEDVEQALVAGAVGAGTGPLLVISVDGAGPGEIVGEGPRGEERFVTVDLRGGDDLDRVALVGEGGAVLREWTTPGPHTVRLMLDGRWVAAVAWSTTSEGWAATGPVWTDPP